MADNKSREVRIRDHIVKEGEPSEKYIGDKPQKVGEVTVKVDVDVSEALTGLKALQREAREATKALRELGDASKIDVAELVSNLYPITYEDAETILEGIMQGRKDQMLTGLRPPEVPNTLTVGSGFGGSASVTTADYSQFRSFSKRTTGGSASIKSVRQGGDDE